MKSSIIITLVLSIVVNHALGQAETAPQSTRTQQACESGYFWSGEYCFACQSVENGYCTCSSINGCNTVVCNQFYINIGSKTSPNCVQATSNLNNCATYKLGNSAVVCESCYSGYQMVGQLCLSSSSCAVYSELSGLCISCQSGFYYDYNEMTNTQTQVCNECLSGCQTCGSQNTCQSCMSNYLWQIDTSTNNGQGSCQTCTANGCTSCPSAFSNCTACGSGYYLSGTSNTQDAYCTPCLETLNGCLTCTSNTTCTSCYSYGYYLLNGACNECGSNCQTCKNSTTCTVCSYGYVLANGTCLACPNYCQSCFASNNVAYCSSCQDTFYMQSNTTCSSCYSQDSTWLRCAGSLDNALYTTLQPTQCQDGYWTVNINGTNQCVEVSQSSNCYAIGSTNNQQCNQCYPGQTLVGTNCYSCAQKFPYCTTCSVTSGSTPSISCSACSSSYFLSNGSCVACSSSCVTCTGLNTCSACQSGYYVNANSACTQCSISGCSTCTANSCSACYPGYFLQTSTGSSGSQACNKCPSECATCNAPGQVCATCYSGYILQNGGCVSYEDQNCLYPNTVTGTCTVCAYGYYLNNGRCELCIDSSAGFVCRDNTGASTTGTTPSTNASLLSALFIAFIVLFSM